MGHFGFSYIGLIYLLALFVPNLIWARKKPEGYSPKKENKILAILERIGQVGCTVVILIFSDFNPGGRFPWSIWFWLSATAMVFYEICWIRYFKKPGIAAFYQSFLGVPLPLATLPVAGFLFLGIYGKVVWLIGFSAILGVGHIGIHLGHEREIAEKGEG